MSQLRVPEMRQKSEFVRPRPPTLAASYVYSCPGRRDEDRHPFDGSTGGTLRAHPGLSLGETHLGFFVLN